MIYTPVLSVAALILLSSAGVAQIIGAIESVTPWTNRRRL